MVFCFVVERELRGSWADEDSERLKAALMPDAPMLTKSEMRVHNISAVVRASLLAAGFAACFGMLWHVISTAGLLAL